MGIDEIADEDKIKGVIKEDRCPFCRKKGVVEQVGSESSIGVGGSNGKIIPTKQWYDFKCKNCKRLFIISKYPYEKVEAKLNK